ncbi:hypothetical protein C2I36_08520 [Rhodobacteraceae bacterium WD3A24]|nr:hypothetical protein C2I36_08520 [Rhodobacteraceae bacterium WD3A24]
MSDVQLEIVEGKIRLRCEQIGDGEILLDAYTAKRLVHGIGSLRAQIEPEPSRELGLGKRTENTLPDPQWYAEPERMEGHALLHLRDIRFGWLHYLMPKESAGKLGVLLQKIASEPSPTDGSPEQ